MAETADALKAFNAMRFNGDGVITADTADQDDAKLLIANVLDTVGGADDRSGKPVTTGELPISRPWRTMLPGSTRHPLMRRYCRCRMTRLPHWMRSMPCGPRSTTSLRCQLAAFDSRAIAALNREEKEYYALTVKDLVITNDEIRSLPLAHIDSAVPLPLKQGLNPAWISAMATFVAKVVQPLLGDIDQLTEAQWNDIRRAWASSKPGRPARLVRSWKSSVSSACVPWRNRCRPGAGTAVRTGKSPGSHRQRHCIRRASGALRA
ncbi:MAG: hypothetical protein R3F47_19780 [Gammaproteobacteria bacterium]